MTRDEISEAEARIHTLPPFDVPNLDAYSVDPMDYAALEKLFDKLVLYCEQKRLAMKYRLKGEVNIAVQCEVSADSVYKKLPKWAQW